MMEFIATVVMGIVTSYCLFFVKRNDGWKAWLGLYAAWMAIAIEMQFVERYILVCLSIGGLIFLVGTAITALVIGIINSRLNNYILVIINRIIIGINFIILMFDMLVISIKLLYPIAIIVYREYQKIKTKKDEDTH